MITIKCKNCGKEVKTYPSRIGRKHFCSHACNASFHMMGNKYAIGSKAWVGRKHTEESKRKMSVGNKGKHLSSETEFKKGIVPWNTGKKSPWLTERNLTNNPCKRGKENHMWRGGITPIGQQIRSSREYILWRTAVFMRDDYTCQNCKQKGGKLEADHIKPFSQYPELRFAIDNGRTLCHECHKQTDTYLSKVFRKHCVASV